MPDVTRPHGGRDAVQGEQAARTALPPARSYRVPGGPLAKNLGRVNVAKLAEVERGGEHDYVR